MKDKRLEMIFGIPSLKMSQGHNDRVKFGLEGEHNLNKSTIEYVSP